MSTSFFAVSQANKAHLGYVGRQPGTPVRDSDEWYTPACYIERARAVMGSIDLDPFSSHAANQVVQAAYYFDPTSSALTRPWRSPKHKRLYPDGVNVWMNPPYAMPMILQAVEALLSACERRDIAQAIVLVNNATETRWFQRLCTASHALCLPRQRIAFSAPDGKAIGGNTRGQAFFYVAQSVNAMQAFLQTFADVGFTLALKESPMVDEHDQQDFSLFDDEPDPDQGPQEDPSTRPEPESQLPPRDFGDPGRQAVRNGSEAEAYTHMRLLRLGYAKLKTMPDQKDTPFFIPQWRSPFKAPYGTQMIPDFYVWHPHKHPRGLLIEHKYQEKPGSADQKLHFAIAGLKNTGLPALLVMTGPGFSVPSRLYCQAQQDAMFKVVTTFDAWIVQLNRGLL